jgi:hypothetical protein
MAAVSAAPATVARACSMAIWMRRLTWETFHPSF